MCHVPLGIQCLYGCSDERSENGNREDGSEVSGGREIVEIVWPLVLPEGNNVAFCWCVGEEV